MKPTHIENLWRMFWESVHPENDNVVQREEMRKAFFAGAHGLMVLILGALDPVSEPTEKDLKLMTEIDAEIKAFARDMEVR